MLWLILVLLVLYFAIAGQSRRSLLRWLEAREPWHIGVFVAALILAGSARVALPLGPILLMAVVIGFAVFWVREFIFLMTRSDMEFPGQYDKLVWGLVMVFLPPIGLFAFWAYRRNHFDAHAKPEPIAGLRDWL